MTGVASATSRLSGTVRLVVFALLLLQLMFAVWALSTPAQAYRPTTHRPKPVPAPVQALPLTLESGQSTATEIAQTWSNDARLVSAVMRVEWPEDPGPSTITMPSDGWIVY